MPGADKGVADGETPRNKNHQSFLQRRYHAWVHARAEKTDAADYAEHSRQEYSGGKWWNSSPELGPLGPSVQEFTPRRPPTVEMSTRVRFRSGRHFSFH
jgi:hypothetical protein